ncbi:MAG TPA: hypothetical protein VNN72_01880 [Polyangiaceae bacterium]|nr:hypothetical protein [Polyangiaceae bacterium]
MTQQHATRTSTHFVTRALTSVVPVLALAAGGCLERPVTPVQPNTTNVFVSTIANRAVDKVDLLFMIDNSLSMADKQDILAQAVPVLVKRLVTPTCIDDDGKPLGVSDANGHCAQGSPEFNPVKDVHLGVITSSLGGYGGTECQPDSNDPLVGRTPDDRAELVPTANPAVRGQIVSWNDSGFLAWDPTGTKNTPPGENNLDHLTANFRDHVTKAGESGCGYEGSLEAWYRFLVDPEPPLNVTATSSGPGQPVVATRGPVNETVLAQRKAFLRPDSLLSIVMLTDENDCSLIDDDGTQGWLAASQTVSMPHSSAACADNPDDRCCHSCAIEAPSGCTPNASDAECSKGNGSYATVPARDDSPHLRCFDQKRRFGLDLLHPTSRYVDGLTKTMVPNRAGKLVQNPIFAAADGKPARSASLVLLTGIVGVPWQDLATPDSLSGRNLTYLNASELAKEGRWDVILGGATGPSDPLMHESIAARTGENPITGSKLAPPDASGEMMNPINGHEQNVVRADDLQYACTFPLMKERPCTDANDDSCDCTTDYRDYNRPLCRYEGAAGTGGVQIAAKAYPGLRELAVLRGVGDNGIVASICPKNTLPAANVAPEADPAYGYNPAIAAMAEIFKSRLAQQCLPRPLPVETDPKADGYGQVPCSVVEAVPSSGASCSCDPTQGRLPLAADDDKLRDAVRTQLRAEGTCGGTDGTSCNDYCMCRIESLEGSELTACQNGHENGETFGYCYVDPAQGIGSPELVKACPATDKRSLRFVGEGLPAIGSVTFMACQGKSFIEAATE